MPAAHGIATGLYPPKSVAGEKPARPFRFDPSRILPSNEGSFSIASHKHKLRLTKASAVKQYIPDYKV